MNQPLSLFMLHPEPAAFPPAVVQLHPPPLKACNLHNTAALGYEYETFPYASSHPYSRRNFLIL